MTNVSTPASNPVRPVSAGRLKTRASRVLDRLPRLAFRLYFAFFLTYLLLPLLILAAATFNRSSFPTIVPWLGTTDMWIAALFRDAEMLKALGSSAVIAAGVIAISLPVGTAAALVLTSLHGRARNILYALMVSPLLTPGVVIGIATLLFWRKVGIGGGVALSILAQSSFIISFVMLMVAARLQRFDRTMEDAALGLGASRIYVFRRILLPFLRPALVGACFIAFLQSFENYNTTLFVRGTETPLTIFIASKVRAGLTPVVNALGLVMMITTLAGAIAWEVIRRRKRIAAGPAT
ncbi:Inner membrane ABC transporter permease protein YdcV [Ensifer adhaerens]|uniref:ABC transporter permease n=1 Tax=Ensifer adhaerens TaxID=106592 RepID=UPI0015695D8B|nr:ABC transporter permease [Ensifer adhaerens]NRP20182.1 Inner membrane ABC transporter permease protein YdcV [Ensifer adhaerens]